MSLLISICVYYNSGSDVEYITSLKLPDENLDIKFKRGLEIYESIYTPFNIRIFFESIDSVVEKNTTSYNYVIQNNKILDRDFILKEINKIKLFLSKTKRNRSINGTVISDSFSSKLLHISKRLNNLKNNFRIFTKNSNDHVLNCPLDYLAVSDVFIFHNFIEVEFFNAGIPIFVLLDDLNVLKNLDKSVLVDLVNTDIISGFIVPSIEYKNLLNSIGFRKVLIDINLDESILFTYILENILLFSTTETNYGVPLIEHVVNNGSTLETFYQYLPSVYTDSSETVEHFASFASVYLLYNPNASRQELWVKFMAYHHITENMGCVLIDNDSFFIRFLESVEKKIYVPNIINYNYKNIVDFFGIYKLNIKDCVINYSLINNLSRFDFISFLDNLFLQAIENIYIYFTYDNDFFLKNGKLSPFLRLSSINTTSSNLFEVKKGDLSFIHLYKTPA